jgi:hypothetical protein
VRVSVSGSPPSASHRVSLGLVFEATVPSSRNPEIFYRVALLGDGSWACSCPGFANGRRKDRLCRHVDQVREAYERSFTLAGLLE